jgi:hypothetical protein
MTTPVYHANAALNGALSLYAQAGKLAVGRQLVARVNPQKIGRDYGVHATMLSDLGHLGGVELHPGYNNLRKYVNKIRKEVQQTEVAALHRQFLNQGGQDLIGSDEFEAYLSAMLQGERVVNGGMVLASGLFGQIDTNQLNQGLAVFMGGPGQGLLIANLAVVSGKFPWNLSKLGPALRHVGGNLKIQNWKRFPIDWRRLRSIEVSGYKFKPARGGCREFAKKWADGDMLKAYKIASAILGDQFKELEWGSQINLKESDVDAVKGLLIKKTASGAYEYAGVAGYRRFAKSKYAGGDMLTAYKIASAILGDEFKELEWGGSIILKERAVDTVKALLIKKKEGGAYEYAGLAGYRRFAKSKYAGGDMFKAYIIASAILGDEFKELEWGSSIKLKEKEVDVVEVLLKEKTASGAYENAGVAGYRRFAKSKYAGGDMIKAHLIASAILGDQFKELEWGSSIKLKEKEVDVVEALLKEKTASGAYEYAGLAGYRRFAKSKYADGDMLKAYMIASAILGDQFKELEWGNAMRPKEKEVDAIKALLKEKTASGAYEYAGLAGYRMFAKSKYGGGDMSKAYQIASAILREEFKELEWERAIALKEKEVDVVEALLKEKTASGVYTYAGPAGYRRFAKSKYAGGDMTKAYQIASAILREEFKGLEWGSSIKLKEKEVDVVEALLKEKTASGAYGYAGLAGYRRFAKSKYAGGDMTKAYQIASAILGEEFKELEWERAIALKEKEVDVVEALLKEKTASGEYEYAGIAGYRRFAGSKYGGGDMKKAHQVASAILGEEFKELEWGISIALKEKDYDHLVEILKGVKRDEAGFIVYLKALPDYVSALNARKNASAVLGIDQLATLGWPLFTSLIKFPERRDWIR